MTILVAHKRTVGVGGRGVTSDSCTSKSQRKIFQQKNLLYIMKSVCVLNKHSVFVEEYKL